MPGYEAKLVELDYFGDDDVIFKTVRSHFPHPKLDRETVMILYERLAMKGKETFPFMAFWNGVKVGVYVHWVAGERTFPAVFKKGKLHAE